jgi:transposase-like protein
MDMSLATKKQLLQIALNEKCPMSFKYEACMILQQRWSSDMLEDLIRLYGRGEDVWYIAEYLGTTIATVKGMIKKYKLRRVVG